VKVTVAAMSAEKMFVTPAPGRHARRVGRVRAWRRAERVAYGVLVEARRSGDGQLVERARRGWSELRGRERP
jgi:hypothetical protein